jgi:hypothetical protein
LHFFWHILLPEESSSPHAISNAFFMHYCMKMEWNMHIQHETTNSVHFQNTWFEAGEFPNGDFGSFRKIKINTNQYGVRIKSS